MKDWKTNLEELLDKDERNFIDNLTGIRSNKISLDFVSKIPVSINSKKTKISHVASLRTLSAKDLLIKAFNKKDVQSIIKSVLDIDLGYRLEKVIDEMIYFSLMPFTEEARMKIVKKCKDNLENAKIAFRNSRQKALTEIKVSKLPVDQDKRARKQVDEIINHWISRATKIYEQKLAELNFS